MVKIVKQLVRSVVTICMIVAIGVSSVSAFWSGDRLRNYNWNSMPTIRSGSSGGAVKGCQQYLLSEGYGVGNVDGSFGSKTVAAVKQYQKNHGLSQDGVVGSNTWSNMNSRLAYYDTGPVNYSYVPGSASFGDDRFKHQHSASASQGSIGSWWVDTDSAFVKMCS